jgi:hypothetical protein
MRWSGHVVHIGEIRNASNIFLRNPVGKIPPGRPRHRWGIVLKEETGRPRHR